MTASLASIGRAALKPQQFARKAANNPQLLPEILKGVSGEAARARFGCAKTLQVLSKSNPELLYPHFDFFVRLLDSPNKILQWEAALVLAELAHVDADDKFSQIFDKYFAPIGGPVMITAANVIRGGAEIVAAKPHLADRIAAEVLKVASARYQTAECRNVAISHAIVAFGEFLHLLRDPAPVIRFVQGQLRNSRPATRKKAEQFLKTLQKRGKTWPVHSAATGRATRSPARQALQ